MSTHFVRIWNKSQVNQFSRQLLAAGYEVKWGNNGETCQSFNGDDLVFASLVAGRVYMCRINRLYVTEADTIPVAV